MHVIEIDDSGTLQALTDVFSALADADNVYHLRVAIDPVDNGLKFSVNGSTWTRPYKGKITN